MSTDNINHCGKFLSISQKNIFYRLIFVAINNMVKVLIIAKLLNEKKQTQLEVEYLYEYWI